MKMSYLDAMIDSSDAFEFNLIQRNDLGVCCLDLTSSDEISYDYEKNQIQFKISSEGYDKNYMNYLRKYYRDILVDRMFSCSVRGIDGRTDTVGATFRKLSLCPKIGYSTIGTYMSYIGYEVTGVFEITDIDSSVKDFIDKSITEWNDYYVDRVFVANPID